MYGMTEIKVLVTWNFVQTWVAHKFCLIRGYSRMIPYVLKIATCIINIRVKNLYKGWTAILATPLFLNVQEYRKNYKVQNLPPLKNGRVPNMPPPKLTNVLDSGNFFGWPVHDSTIIWGWQVLDSLIFLDCWQLGGDQNSWSPCITFGPKRKSGPVHMGPCTNKI